MARKDKTILDIAKTVNMNRDTLSKKLSGRSKLNLNEAFAIQQTCFPDIDIRMLFKESCINSVHHSRRQYHILEERCLPSSNL